VKHIARRLLAALLALLPRSVEAHPLDELAQSAYLTIAPGEVRLELDLTPGIEVAGPLLHAMDGDGNRMVTGAEARIYAGDVLARSSLSLDHVATSLVAGDAEVPPYRRIEPGGTTISIHGTAQRLDSVGAHVLTYRNDHQPGASRRTAHVFLRPGNGWQYRVTGQQRSDDGRQLTVTYVVTRQ
jgi:hypothetical protein